jgi:4-hydroxybenzoate polyprenyltransferase
LTPPPTNDNLAPSRANTPSEDPRWDHPAGFRQLLKEAVPRFKSKNAWLRLLRIPNFLTVPGDILAGFLLAPVITNGNWGSLLLAIPTGLLLYAAGLLLNDVFDYPQDLRERPSRPLPSGAIHRETAGATALVLLWMAAFLAASFDALSVGIPLILCIVLYDAGGKKIPVLGPVLMGACRSGNLLLGAAAAAGTAGVLSPAPLAAAVLLGLYIAAVTHLARNEARPGARITPRHIGRLLQMLIPIQALFCVLAIHRFPANLLGLLLLPLMPLHHRLSSRFPPS